MQIVVTSPIPIEQRTTLAAAGSKFRDMNAIKATAKTIPPRADRIAAAGLTAYSWSLPIEFSLNFLGAINLNNPRSVNATAMIVNAKLVSIFIPFFSIFKL